MTYDVSTARVDELLTRAEEEFGGIERALTQAISTARRAETGDIGAATAPTVFARLDDLVRTLHDDLTDDVAVIASVAPGCGIKSTTSTCVAASVPASVLASVPASVRAGVPAGVPSTTTRATRAPATPVAAPPPVPATAWAAAPLPELAAATQSPPRPAPPGPDVVEEEFWHGDTLTPWHARLSPRRMRVRMLEAGSVVALVLAILVRFG